MSFSTFDFVFIFLPLFLSVYYLVPAKMRAVLLFAGSALFYCYGVMTAPLCALLLLALMVLSYFAGIALEREPDSTLLGVMLFLFFGILFFFKYNGFFLKEHSLALPLGISFYLFSMSGYLIDIYRGDSPAEHRFLYYSAHVMMFPKLISGPITPYRALRGEMEELGQTESKLRLANLDSGVRTFLYGLGLKVLLADRLSGLWSEASGIGFESLSAPMAWLCAVAFSLRLYFDFWGYSLMAIGAGEMLGYTLPENFRHPYAAKSISDFWRRWHITLSGWFRDYIYIPLGGNRRGTARMLFNLLMVWLATGVWHGATANFLLWAGFLFLIITLEKLTYGKLLEKTKVLCHLYVVVLAVFSWVLFAVTDLPSLGVYVRQLFDFQTAPGREFFTLLREYGTYLAAGVLFSIPVVHRTWEEKIKYTPLGTLVLLVVFFVCLYAMAMGQNDPFLYFGF